MCRRCVIGSHECIYPCPVEGQRRAKHAEPPDPQLQATDEDHLSDNSEEAFESSGSTSTSTQSPSVVLVKYRTDDPMAKRFHDAFVNAEHRWAESSTFEFPIEFIRLADSPPIGNHLPRLFGTPRPIRDDLIPFFLSYHQQNINYGRYFWYCDHYQFIKEGLLDLAKLSDPLQYAIAAFSALIYSIQHDHRMKRFTFLFYAKALQKLQQVLDSDAADSEISIYTTVATILELASIEACPCRKLSNNRGLLPTWTNVFNM